jgi:hypothetical protein
MSLAFAILFKMDGEQSFIYFQFWCVSSFSK